MPPLKVSTAQTQTVTQGPPSHGPAGHRLTPSLHPASQFAEGWGGSLQLTPAESRPEGTPLGIF